MGVRLPSVASTAIVNVNPVNANETIVCQVGPFSLSLDNQPVLLFGYCAFTSGAGNASTQLRFRRGNVITAPQLNQTITYTLGAAFSWSMQLNYVDAGAGAGAAMFYVLTYQGNGASGNATITDVCLVAMCL